MMSNFAGLHYGYMTFYDPAVIDYTEWFKWKKGHGVYTLTLEKSNSAFQVSAMNNLSGLKAIALRFHEEEFTILPMQWS